MHVISYLLRLLTAIASKSVLICRCTISHLSDNTCTGVDIELEDINKCIIHALQECNSCMYYLTNCSIYNDTDNCHCPMWEFQRRL